MQNLVYEWVDFSKFGQIWAKIGSSLRKFRKKIVILFKIWPKIGPIGIWMGYFFLKNWYLYGSTFKFHGGTSLLKSNLSTPPGAHSMCFLRRQKYTNICPLLRCLRGRYSGCTLKDNHWYSPLLVKIELKVTCIFFKYNFVKQYQSGIIFLVNPMML